MVAYYWSGQGTEACLYVMSQRRERQKPTYQGASADYNIPKNDHSPFTQPIVGHQWSRHNIVAEIGDSVRIICCSYRYKVPALAGNYDIF